ncbi:MAG: dissimilatory sulfite reductase D family protein [Desulfarculaceae bacterium]|jgi:hypothetical protein|nr:dissimilatory sulfite reductase D family protein [Desulfarculaceae bacterium]
MSVLDNREEATKMVTDYLQKKLKNKTKFYLNDFYKVFPDDKPRQVKKFVNSLVTDGVLEYWSSGSTTMYGLKGAGKQHASEGEE